MSKTTGRKPARKLFLRTVDWGHNRLVERIHNELIGALLEQSSALWLPRVPWRNFYIGYFAFASAGPGQIRIEHVCRIRLRGGVRATIRRAGGSGLAHERLLVSMVFTLTLLQAQHRFPSPSDYLTPAAFRLADQLADSNFTSRGLWRSELLDNDSYGLMASICNPVCV